MRLVIVRHGKAKPDSPSGRDFDRDLKTRGVRQAAYVAERLGAMEPGVTRVIASNAVRTRRTAQVIAEGLGADLETDDRLLVDEPVSGVIELLSGVRGESAVVLVGHNPQLEQLVAVLGGGPLALGVPLRTGEAVVMEIDAAEPMESGAELDRFRLDEPE